MESIREYLDKTKETLLTLTKQRATSREILLPVSKVTSLESYSLTGRVRTHRAVEEGGVMILQIIGNEDDSLPVLLVLGSLGGDVATVDLGGIPLEERPCKWEYMEALGILVETGPFRVMENAA